MAGALTPGGFLTVESALDSGGFSTGLAREKVRSLVRRTRDALSALRTVSRYAPGPIGSSSSATNSGVIAIRAGTGGGTRLTVSRSARRASTRAFSMESCCAITRPESARARPLRPATVVSARRVESRTATSRARATESNADARTSDRTRTRLESARRSSTWPGESAESSASARSNTRRSVSESLTSTPTMRAPSVSCMKA